MSKNLLALFAATLFSTTCSAASIVIDSFDSTQGPVLAAPVLTTGTTVSGGGYWNTRVLSSISTSGTSIAGAFIEVVNGQLQIASGPTSSAVSTVTWNLDLAALNTALAQTTLIEVTLDQILLDVGSVDVGIGSTPRTSAQNASTVLIYSGSAAGLANPFKINFSASIQADSVWDNLKISYTCVAGATSISDADRTGSDGCAVSTPATLPLLALGLVTAVALRRKRF